jgi:membrane-associated phospholipid phosphatase
VNPPEPTGSAPPGPGHEPSPPAAPTTHRRRVARAAAALLLPPLVAAAVPSFPGEAALARALQALGPSADLAWTLTQTIMPPAVWVVIGLGLAGAAWQGGRRGALVAALLVALWRFGGEPLKSVVQRARPTAAVVEVTRPTSGWSFPSTFATTWYSAWLPMAVFAARRARRRRPDTERRAPTLVAAAGGALLLAGAWARVRMGAHWPSDLALTLVMVAGSLGLVEALVDTLTRTRTDTLQRHEAQPASTGSG